MTHHAGYPPFDAPKPVDDGVWIVDAEPIRPSGLPLPLPVRMTALKLGNGDLLLYSPTRHTAALQRELEGIGPIRHIVAPSVAHWMFAHGWQRACPGAVTWGAPGLGRRRQVRAAGLRIDAVLEAEPPAAWRGEVDQVMVTAGPFAEVAMFHRPSRTLLVADLALNIEEARMPAAAGTVWRAAGTTAPHGHAPLQLRLLLSLNADAVADAARRLVAFAPRRVVVSHGKPFDGDAPTQLRAALRPLLEARETRRNLYGAGAALAGLLIATGWLAARRRSVRAAPQALTGRRRG